MTDTTTATPQADSVLDPTVVDTYMATWNETDAVKRRELVEASLGADLWYRDPLLEADGLDAYDAMIAGVQAQFPGLVMRRTSPLDGHRDLVRFHWAFGEPGADPVFAGIDIAKYDGDGKLHRIIGFVPETVPAG
jgi:SnoaL-like domain